MNKIESILNDTEHRPWELPTGPWQYYQEWNRALFLHWEIPLDTLRHCIPNRLTIDSINGRCYVSLVAFTMENLRPANLPSCGLISNFHEVNLRTYINHNNKKGVYFLSIDVSKYLSAFIAKKLSGLPYEKSFITRTHHQYSLINEEKNINFNTEYDIKSLLVNKTELDKWLTERYCLYLNKKNKLYRYDIHHKEWEIKVLDLKKNSLDFNLNGINLTDKPPDISHYSDGIKVISWNKQLI